MGKTKEVRVHKPHIKRYSKNFPPLKLKEIFDFTINGGEQIKLNNHIRNKDFVFKRIEKRLHWRNVICQLCYVKIFPNQTYMFFLKLTISSSSKKHFKINLEEEEFEDINWFERQDSTCTTDEDFSLFIDSELF